MLNLEEKTLSELKELAKENNIKNISKLKKEDLVEVLSKVLNNDNEQDEGADTQDLSGYKLTNEGDEIVEGILDILPDGYGFLRGENYLSSPKDVYISMVQIRRFKLDTGDIIKGISRFKEGEKFPSLIFVGEVNGESQKRQQEEKDLMN